MQSRYIETQEDQQYEWMLEELREADPEEYEYIIDLYGYSDLDLFDIIKDI
jgi:hypothetical protein